MTRPLAHDPQLIRQAAISLAGEFGVDPADDGSIDDLVAVTRDHPGDDEYQKARALEGLGWLCDRSTVDAFDHLDGHIQDMHRAAVREWVRKCHIQPRLAIGAPVEVVRRRHTHCGVVAGIRAEDGHYLVRVPSEGHVEPGQLGVQGWMVPFEELHDICNDPGDFALAHPPGNA